MKPPKSEKEALEAIRTAVRTGKVEMAPSDMVGSLYLYVDKILEAVGHPEAMVTDESLISDFMDMNLSKKDMDKWYEDISRKLKIKINPRDSIISIANNLKTCGMN